MFLSSFLIGRSKNFPPIRVLKTSMLKICFIRSGTFRLLWTFGTQPKLVNTRPIVLLDTTKSRFIWLTLLCSVLKFYRTKRGQQLPIRLFRISNLKVWDSVKYLKMQRTLTEIDFLKHFSFPRRRGNDCVLKWIGSHGRG